jgi:transposase-like protein
MNRKRYTPEFKSKVVLELLREEKTLSQISAEYGVHPNLLSKWKADFLERMPSIFTKDTAEFDKLRREHAAEKEELITQIGQLSVENTWLKKTYRKALDMKPRKS